MENLQNKQTNKKTEEQLPELGAAFKATGCVRSS